MQTVPTSEEMLDWFPSSLPEDRRFTIEINVQTGERKEIDLTLDEYRARHVSKIISKNRRELRAIEDARQARRNILLQEFIDSLEIK